MNIVNFHSDFYYSNYELLYLDQAVRFLTTAQCKSEWKEV